jgi:hypothetical protein
MRGFLLFALGSVSAIAGAGENLYKRELTSSEELTILTAFINDPNTTMMTL